MSIISNEAFKLRNTQRDRRIEMGNSKNGYELRTDLLGMAIGILENRATQLLQNEHLKPEGTRNAVEPYTTDDVLSEAERLYQFVQDKG
jgi:hypothetical protein